MAHSVLEESTASNDDVARAADDRVAFLNGVRALSNSMAEFK